MANLCERPEFQAGRLLKNGWMGVQMLRFWKGHLAKSGGLIVFPDSSGKLSFSIVHRLYKPTKTPNRCELNSWMIGLTKKNRLYHQTKRMLLMFCGNKYTSLIDWSTNDHVKNVEYVCWMSKRHVQVIQYRELCISYAYLISAITNPKSLLVFLTLPVIGS
jgi:hypothetical protein